MFITATSAQIKLLLRQKEARVAFYVLLALCLSNYIGNVLTFQGYDVIEMYHPMKLLLLSFDMSNYNVDRLLFFMQLYPLLVVCPAGFALVKEQHTRQEALIVSRIGLFQYRLSKLAAAFAVTAIVCTVPFLVEMLLNCIAFPLGAEGDLMNWGYYTEDYMDSVRHYSMSSLFIKAPYLYTFLSIIFFGLVSGVLGAFTVAFSALVKVKYKVFLFFPVFMLINATHYIDQKFPDAVSTNWYYHVLIFFDENKNYGYFWISLLLCVLFIFGAVFSAGFRERLYRGRHVRKP